MADFSYDISVDRWPLREAFTIARASHASMEIVTLTLQTGDFQGRGECQPNPRFGESASNVVDQLEQILSAAQAWCALRADAVPSHTAQNALDCALLDLKAKHADKRVWERAGVQKPGLVPTFFTLSLDRPENMAAAAFRAGGKGLRRLKLKLGRDGDEERLLAVKEAVPDALLVVDANEGWHVKDIEQKLAFMHKHGVLFVEQPLPEAEDSALAAIKRPLPVCADESFKRYTPVSSLKDRYDMINIKLDKMGGFTPAQKALSEARRMQLQVLVGCMVCTSLGAAPAQILAAEADYADLDGPLLLAQDREIAIGFTASETGDYCLQAPTKALWG